MTTRDRIKIVLGIAAVAMAISAGPAQAAIEDDLGILTAETLAGINPAGLHFFHQSRCITCCIRG